MRYCLNYCPLKIKITQFPDGFRLSKRNGILSISNAILLTKVASSAEYCCLFMPVYF